MTDDLRRLRLHQLSERVPGTHRYRLTARGLKTALFYPREYARILRPGLALIHTTTQAPRASLQRTFNAAQRAVDSWCDEVKLAA